MFHARTLSPALLFAAACLAAPQTTSTMSAPGQPSRTDAPIGQFEIVGNSIASAQQVSCRINFAFYLGHEALGVPYPCGAVARIRPGGCIRCVTRPPRIYNANALLIRDEDMA